MLDSNVEGLSIDLGNAQQKFALDTRTQRAQEMALSGKIAEDKILIQNLTAELTEYQQRDLPGMHAQLATEHGQLLSASRAAQQVVGQVTQDMAVAKKAKEDELAKTEGLKTYLIEVHHYNSACHDRVKALEKDVRVASAVEPRETAGLEAAKRQAQATAQATEQRLLSEGALLKAAIRKVELTVSNEIKNLHQSLSEYDELQASILSEVQILEAKIAQEKARIQSLTVSLQENVATENEDMGMEKMLQEELAKLRGGISPITVATLQGENDALQAELNQAALLLAESQGAEAHAIVNAQEAKAQADAARESQGIAEESMRQARAEGEKQLKAEIAKMKESQDKSQMMLQKAEGAIAARCRDPWKTRQEEKDVEMAQCNRDKDELVMVKAQEDTLKQTLEAQQQG